MRRLINDSEDYRYARPAVGRFTRRIRSKHNSQTLSLHYAYRVKSGRAIRFLTILSISIVALSAISWIGLGRITAAIPKSDVFGDLKDRPKKASSAVNYLIVGSDTRGIRSVTTRCTGCTEFSQNPSIGTTCCGQFLFFLPRPLEPS